MKRCAVYTRKSTEEGLEQGFNSLQAQREACEAYIRSQKHEGWKLVRARFDDGGHSGGTLDRPALQQLLSAIDRNEIDVVVVYKVDRLTRSLADFAKIVERMDNRGVSFVSVTQQFNTTSSMGRLTLNVLLSFAQFEREVTAERIRDKIAASKKKGMWMGGRPPLGYDAIDKKLVVNEQEAETVRTLFDLYLELGTVRALQREAEARGIRTKRLVDRNGRPTGGKPFTRGNLYVTLANPIYTGMVRHKGRTWPGQHRAVIDEATWQAVQDRLAGNAADRTSTTNARSRSLLTGLIFDETGDRLSPIHANKAGKRYRYYISRRLMHEADQHNGWRLPAKTVDDAVVRMVSDVLVNHRRLVDMAGGAADANRLVKTMIEAARRIAERLRVGSDHDRRALVRELIERVDLAEQTLTITLSRSGLDAHLGVGLFAGSAEAITMTEPICFRRRGVESRLVLRDREDEPNVDPRLCRLIARAPGWFRQLARGEVVSVGDLAKVEGTSATAITRMLPLAFLAPDIVEAILNGRQPDSLTVTSLRQLAKLPPDWADQRRILGF